MTDSPELTFKIYRCQEFLSSEDVLGRGTSPCLCLSVCLSVSLCLQMSSYQGRPHRDYRKQVVFPRVPQSTGNLPGQSPPSFPNP